MQVVQVSMAPAQVAQDSSQRAQTSPTSTVTSTGHCSIQLCEIWSNLLPEWQEVQVWGRSTQELQLESQEVHCPSTLTDTSAGHSA